MVSCVDEKPLAAIPSTADASATRRRSLVQPLTPVAAAIVLAGRSRAAELIEEAPVITGLLPVRGLPSDVSSLGEIVTAVNLIPGGCRVRRILSAVRRSRLVHRPR